MADIQVVGAKVPKDATAKTRPDLFGTRGQLRPDGDGGITSAMLADKPEYASPADSGVTDGFYVEPRGLPWHVTLARQLGEAERMKGVGSLLTAAEAYVAAGCFEVEKVPVADSETGTIVPGHFVTRRADTKEPIGVVGRSWQAHQERDLIETCVNIVDSGEASFETAAHLSNYARFFVGMELDHLDIKVPGDPSPLRTYLLASTSHDGSKKTGFYITHVRPVCKNTERLAIAGAITEWTIRHNVGSPTGRIEEARRALQISFRNQDLFKQLTAKLAKTKVVDDQVAEILARAVWPVKAAEGDAEAERKSRHVDRALEVYFESPNLEGIRGTAWGAYNAVTEYVDHVVDYRGGKRQSAEDAKVDSLLYGGGAAAKDRALAALVRAGK